MSEEKKRMESPFENDPFAMVYQGFKRLYPDKDCKIFWNPDEMKDDEGNGYIGMTHFADDGEVTVEISVYMPIVEAVETFAHELAHVAVGASEEHGEVWEKAFDAIHEEFDKIGVEMFGEDSGTDVEVSDGKGGLAEDKYCLMKKYEYAIEDLVKEALLKLHPDDFCKMVRNLQLVIRDPSDPEADSFPVELE